jgi:hypothetical protein
VAPVEVRVAVDIEVAPAIVERCSRSVVLQAGGWLLLGIVHIRSATPGFVSCAEQLAAADLILV